MLDKLNAAFTARRVLLVGGHDRMTLFFESLLGALGARPARIPPSSGAETVCRALTAGRVSALIVPSLPSLAPQRDEAGQLAALSMLLGEAREAGVPLTILCSEVNVYRARQGAWYAREEDPIGGETREGLAQSLLQLYADGVSRGLCGDAVHVLCVRTLPSLGCGSPAVAQYSAWCRALDAGDLPEVAHPAMQGVFVHPLDMICGALMLGARFFAGEEPCDGIWNLAPGPHNLCANRSAALRFIARNGGTRPIRETEPPVGPVLPLPDGARARLLCNFRCLLGADEALDALLAMERASAEGRDAEWSVLRAQTGGYIERLSQ